MGSFFEEFGKKLTQTGQGALEKTKQMTEISKLNIKLAEEDEQLEKLYANLGRLYYQQLNEKEPEILFQDICQAVAGSIKNMNYYQKAINDLKGIKHCETCGEEVQEGACYCSHCGQHLDKEAQAQVYRLCTNCGTVCSGLEEHCQKCENPL